MKLWTDIYDRVVMLPGAEKFPAKALAKRRAELVQLKIAAFKATCATNRDWPHWLDFAGTDEQVEDGLSPSYAVTLLRDRLTTARWDVEDAILEVEVEAALLRRRLELARIEQKAWEYLWRFDMTYMTGIELCLREQVALLTKAVEKA